MNIYVRKLFNHDITHEVSVTTSIVERFFDNKTSFKVVKDGDSHEYEVTINNATDPRFGGDFKRLYADDNVSVGDCLLLKKVSDIKYEFQLLKKESSYYGFVDTFFGGEKDRHAIVYVEQNLASREISISTDYRSSENINYLAAIKTKPFLIFGGFSGTGKSLKVKELAFKTCPCNGELNVSETSPGNYQLIPVKPNWHDASELTGFYSSVNRNYYVTDFMRFLVKAKHYESQKIPFFVCLDEMNLAYVEEYLADFLSIVESRKRLDDGRIVSDALVSASIFNNKNYADDFNIFMSLGLQTIEDLSVDEINALVKNGEEDIFVRQDIVDDLKENGLTLPQNVVVVGTVNMDDTTNNFSRKVIDRAMTFETVIESFSETDYFGRLPILSYVENPIPGTLILPDEVSANKMIVEGRFSISDDDKKKVIDFINDINSDLEGTPFKISYRVINETVLLYRAKQIVCQACSGVTTVNVEDVFDDILMRKILPRIEGEYDKCNACLVKLAARSAENNWVNSSGKIEFMIGRFGQDQSGLTTFWN